MTNAYFLTAVNSAAVQTLIGLARWQEVRGLGVPPD
jgi:hypothetical protein